MPSSDREVWGWLKSLKMSVDLLDDYHEEIMAAGPKLGNES